MGSENLSELPRIKSFICKIHMFLCGATSRKQQQEEPAVLDAENASGHEAGRAEWAEASHGEHVHHDNEGREERKSRLGPQPPCHLERESQTSYRYYNFLL